MNKPQPNDSEDNALWEEITRDIRKLPAREIPPSKPVILPEIKPSVNLAAAYRGEILPELAVGDRGSLTLYGRSPGARQLAEEHQTEE